MKNKSSFNNCFRVRSIKINNQSKEIISDFDSTCHKDAGKKARVRTSKAGRRPNRLSFDSKKLINKFEVKDEDNVSWIHNDGLNDHIKVGIVIGDEYPLSSKAKKQEDCDKKTQLYDLDPNKIQSFNEYNNIVEKDEEETMFNNFEFTSEMYLSKSKEQRTSLVQINKGKVIQNNTKVFTQSQYKSEDNDVVIQKHNREFGDTYFKRLGEKLQLQHPDLQLSESNQFENFRNSFITPKSNIL